MGLADREYNQTQASCRYEESLSGHHTSPHRNGISLRLNLKQIQSSHGLPAARVSSVPAHSSHGEVRLGCDINLQPTRKKLDIEDPTKPPATSVELVVLSLSGWSISVPESNTLTRQAIQGNLEACGICVLRQISSSFGYSLAEVNLRHTPLPAHHPQRARGTRRDRGTPTQVEGGHLAMTGDTLLRPICSRTNQPVFRTAL